MLLLLAMAVGRGVLHFHWDGVDHFVEYHLIWLLAPLILYPAVVKARHRSKELRLLTSISTCPGPRLRAAAEAVGVDVHELPVPSCECFVAGAWRPAAYVSAEAVERMSDAELRAALHHERAHVEGHDPALYIALSFLIDLVPTSDKAIQAYRQARERRADVAAAARAGALTLASALIAVARPRPTSAIGMAGGDAAWRLRAILAVEPKATSQAPPARLIAALAANGAFLTWPAAQVALAYLLCTS